MKAGWKTVKLGEACKIVNGATPSTSVEANWGGPHCWITPAEMGGLSDPYVGETRRTLTDVGLADCSTSLLPKGSVILSSRAPIGHVIINTVPMATNQGCKSMIPRSDLDAKFLFYFIKANVPLLESLGTGATFKELSGGKLASVEIPLPPLAEQKRIVALLDEAFAGIDEAKAKADLNLSSSKIIIGLHLKSIFNQGGCAANEGWQKTKLLNLADVQSGSAFPTERQGKVPNGIPFYKVSDMNISGNERYMINENNSVTEDVRRILSASIFPKGSIIFPKVGGAIATNKKRITTRVCCVDNNVMGAIPKPGKMTSEFLYYFFLAYNLSEFANEAHLPSIKKTTVEEWELSVPRNTKDQECIVEKLDVLTDNIHKLTQITERKITALVELKSSLLTQAFAGELTA